MKTMAVSKVLTVNSFNCRGLREKTKRQYFFNWLKKSYNGVIFLQETHCTGVDELKWQKEFNGIGYFSNGTNQSRGVAILVPNNLQFEFKVLSHKTDLNGRLIMIDSEIESCPFSLVNVYAPTGDRLNEQLAFINDLRNILLNLGGTSIPISILTLIEKEV